MRRPNPFVVIALGLTCATTAGSAQSPPVDNLSGGPQRALATAEPPFSDGPGSSAFLEICSTCHRPDIVLGKRKTPSEWNATLYLMETLGATATDDDWSRIFEYLVSRYALILVNEAPAEDLQSMLDVPAAVADAIVHRRSTAGRFESIDDLKQVEGIDKHRIDSRRSRLLF